MNIQEIIARMGSLKGKTEGKQNHQEPGKEPE
jgi:hypothetical protein